MRLLVGLMIAGLAAPGAMAQTVSPMTGTTAAPPAPNTVGTTPGSVSPRAPAARAAAPRMTMAQRYEAANTTKDGKLTLDQAKAGKMPRVAANFDAIDTGKKGYVTLDDIRAYNRAHRPAARPAAQ